VPLSGLEETAMAKGSVGTFDRQRPLGDSAVVQAVSFGPDQKIHVIFGQVVSADFIECSLYRITGPPAPSCARAKIILGRRLVSRFMSLKLKAIAL